MFIALSVSTRSAFPLRGEPTARMPQSSAVRATESCPSALSLWHSRREENLSPWEVTLSL